MSKQKEILEGYRVLDFGRYIAGPFCGALLSDFGAEVIRVERVKGVKTDLPLLFRMRKMAQCFYK